MVPPIPFSMGFEIVSCGRPLVTYPHGAVRASFPPYAFPKELLGLPTCVGSRVCAVGWVPFHGKERYVDIKCEMVILPLEATNVSYSVPCRLFDR